MMKIRRLTTAIPPPPANTAYGPSNGITWVDSFEL